MSASPQVLCWSEQYAVNIETIDHQHQSLFTTVKELSDALEAGRGAYATHVVLEKLIKYALTHFAAEEALMEQHQFPGFHMHTAEHRRFTEQVIGFMAKFRSKDAGVPGALLCFLENWLKHHVMTVDKEYSSYLHERGVC